MAIFPKSSFLDRSCYIKFATPVTIRWCCNLGSKALLWRLPRRPNKFSLHFFIGFWSADWKGDSKHLYTRWLATQIFFIFTPKFVEDEAILTNISFRWVGSTTNQYIYNYTVCFSVFSGGVIQQLFNLPAPPGSLSTLLSNTSFPHWMTVFFAVPRHCHPRHFSVGP